VAVCVFVTFAWIYLFIFITGDELGSYSHDGVVHLYKRNQGRWAEAITHSKSSISLRFAIKLIFNFCHFAGSRPNETNYPEYDSTNLRRELPDLSEDALRREAALILKQAEFTKHRGGRANEPGHGKVERKSQGKKVINNNPQFNSLPTRGKKKTKVVSRSVSDASAKKNKKPSVFSLFGRKSDQNLDKLDNKSPKKVTRSKSDVGTGRSGRRSSTENDDSSQSVSKKKAPLSPIIEASPRDDYFVGRNSPPLFQTKNGDKAPIAAEPLVNPTKPISETIKSAIADLSRHSKSLEEMHLHSSQQPTKARLTKGMTVDGMVKRLSMERFSPPPTDQAFSYIRPKDQIIYAQVVCNNDGNNKQTVHHEFDSSFNRNHSSHFNQVSSFQTRFLNPIIETTRFSR
jgi:hypothetical protein